MTYEAIKVDETTWMVKRRDDTSELLVKADSMLSYLHHRGYINYGKPNAPSRDEVERLFCALRRATQSAQHGRMTESLLRDQPPDATAEQMIEAAVERGSWA